MEHIDYIYTYGMDESDIETHLDAKDVGVLSLAREGDSYAVPISYHYEDGRLFLRLSEDGDSKKMAFLDATETATFLVFDNDASGSWSVLVEGTVTEPTDESFDERRINESFDEFRVFDEDVADVDLHILEFEMQAITGRKSSLA